MEQIKMLPDKIAPDAEELLKEAKTLHAEVEAIKTKFRRVRQRVEAIEGLLAAPREVEMVGDRSDCRCFGL